MAINRRSDVIRVLQISDSHLFADPAGQLMGINTDHSLAWVLEAIQREQSHLHCILATGDIAQDSSVLAYERFKQHLAPLKSPIYWLPGNHDEFGVMAQVVDHAFHLSPCVVAQGQWLIILLNSSVAGEVWGHLSQAQLNFLQIQLSGAKDRHVMICLHHHPVPIGSQWLDEIALHNSDDFFSVIDQHDCVRAIIWGHVHQAFEQERKGVRLFAVPSTCIQFKPQSPTFALEGFPGYRWFDLYPNGDIVSEVSRITPLSWPIDRKAGGY